MSLLAALLLSLLAACSGEPAHGGGGGADDGPPDAQPGAGPDGSGAGPAARQDGGPAAPGTDLGPSDPGTPPADANAGTLPPDPDSGTSPPDPDAGTPPPDPDAGTLPPDPDAGTRPPDPDAGTLPPDPDAGTLPPNADAGTPPPDPDTALGWLHVEGSRLLDASGRPARLTGVNWFGFETAVHAPHGLWTRDYRSVLRQVRDLGFNCLRLPFASAMLAPGVLPQSVSFSGRDPYDGREPLNQGLEGLTALALLDAVIDEAGRLGLRVILDNHSHAPDGYLGEPLWYTTAVDEQQWIAGWVALARRYRDHPAVVGFDLDNEPHGQATWGGGDPSTDWAAAAERCGNAILAVHPEVLILVEGVEQHQGQSSWWGGQLAGARDRPITLSRPDKLVYSPHEYGPEVFAQTWFSAPDYPANLPALWTAHFGYLLEEERGHVLIGEFGIRDQQAQEGRAYRWFVELMTAYGSRASWTFWCLNPNSGDTGGILQDDWVSVHDWKLEVLRPHLAPRPSARPPVEPSGSPGEALPGG